MKTTTKFLKFFTLGTVVIGFILLMAFGAQVKDLIMAHILGQKNLINAVGASGTVLVALGFISLSVILIFGMYEILMGATRKEKGSILLSTIILAVALLLLVYSSIVAFYGLGFIKDAYNCDIYGLDTIIVSVSMAFSLKMPLVIVGATLLILLSIKWHNIQKRKLSNSSPKEKQKIGRLSSMPKPSIYRRSSGETFLKLNERYHVKTKNVNGEWLGDGVSEAFDSKEEVEVIQ